MPIDQILVARPRDLGGFTVRRVLPAMTRRRVGPFTFFDHMGPATFAPGEGMAVRPHPHIALATVTYLFEGEIVHKDSLGSDVAIVPGDVNWMVAGHGIVHSERTSPARRASGGHVHGIQAWVALPTAEEERAPSFEHHPHKTLPHVTKPGARLAVICGTAYAQSSPVTVLSPTMYVSAELDAGAKVALPEEHVADERAVYVASGAIRCEDQALTDGAMAIFHPGGDVVVEAIEPSRVLFVGGRALDGERHIWWNFVSSSQERIEQAKRDWKEGRFPKVPGDDVEFIPLPEE
jgi:redox-sensitive bicupin YhaK (pirin superfamily)